MITPQRRGVLDTTLEPVVGLADGETRWRGMTTSGRGVENSTESERLSALAGVPPGLVPVLARGIDDAAVGFEELVGDLEDREH